MQLERHNGYVLGLLPIFLHRNNSTEPFEDSWANIWTDLEVDTFRYEVEETTQNLSALSNGEHIFGNTSFGENYDIIFYVNT